MKARSLGLASEDLSTLLKIFRRYAPRGAIWAFGSRARGTFRPFSDLDLALINRKPLDALRRAELRYALSESSLPVKVDVVEWARTSPDFRQIIQRDHLVIRTA